MPFLLPARPPRSSPVAAPPLDAPGRGSHHPPMAHQHRLRVRYGETDQMGVVHHANYLLYLEEARTAYMAGFGCPYGELERRGIGLPVRRCELRYRAPARYEDELVVHTRITALRGASFTFSYRLERDGELLAEAEVELACIDLRAEPRRPRLLPEDLALQIRELLEAD